MEYSVELKSVSARALIDGSTVEFRFKDGNGNSVGVAVPLGGVPAFLSGLNTKAQEVMVHVGSGHIHAMDVTEIHSHIAQDGTLVLVIGSTSTPQIVLATTAEQLRNLRDELTALLHEGRLQ